jgi:hypothetical protein
MPVGCEIDPNGSVMASWRRRYGGGSMMNARHVRSAGGLGTSRWRLLMLVVFLLAGAPSVARAQVTAADSAAVLLRTAEEFEREGETEVAAALYTFILEHFGATPAAAEARARLFEPGDRFDPVSRLELPVFGTLFGAWLGVAVPAAFGAESSEAFGAGFLVGAPLGLFSARAAQRARQYSEGQARAISWGGVYGTWQGFGWAEVFDLTTDEICDGSGCYDSGDNEQAIFGSMVLGGLAGVTTGALIARNPVRSGVSSAAQGGSIWGTLYGAAIASFFDPEGDTGLAAALLAGNAGLLAGVGLARKYDLTRPRVRWINLGALAGGLVGLGVDLLVQPDDDNVAIAIPLVASIGGLGIAASATRDLRPNAIEGEGAQDDTGALLGYGPDGWRVAPPLPVPAMLPGEDVNGRTEWRPGITLRLFHATF